MTVTDVQIMLYDYSFTCAAGPTQSAWVRLSAPPLYRLNQPTNRILIQFVAHGAPFYTVVQKLCFALGITLFFPLILLRVSTASKDNLPMVYSTMDPVCLHNHYLDSGSLRASHSVLSSRARVTSAKWYIFQWI